MANDLNSRILPISDFSGRSEVENIIRNGVHPKDFQDYGARTVNGQSGLWINKNEELNWSGYPSIADYPIYNDLAPEILHKPVSPIDCYRRVEVKTLIPPAPQPHGPIRIRYEPNILPPQAPPVVIRQIERTKTPEPFVYREEPPHPPVARPALDLHIPGKQLPPPPRRVVLEIVKGPEKPQPIIIERWKPYVEQSRQVILEPRPADPVQPQVRNLIVIWEPPQCKQPITKRIVYLPEERVDPDEYRRKHVNIGNIPEEYRDIKPEYGVWAYDVKPKQPELVGSDEALRVLSEIYSNHADLSVYKYFFDNYLNLNRPAVASGNADVDPSSLVHVNSDNTVSWAEIRHFLDDVYTKLHVNYDADQELEFFRALGASINDKYSYEKFREAALKYFIARKP